VRREGTGKGKGITFDRFGRKGKVSQGLQLDGSLLASPASNFVKIVKALRNRNFLKLTC
jgi:hypothetical protein